MKRITLSETRATGELDKFIAQEEARVIDGADESQFNALVKAAVRPPQSEDQHRVLDLAVVRTETKLVQIAVHVLL